MSRSCMKIISFKNVCKYSTVSGTYGKRRADIFQQRAIRVSILGADTPTGESTAFLLKQNPLVSNIYLYGTGRVLGIRADLNHMDTKCKVAAFQGKEGLPNAVRCADVTLMLGLDPLKEDARPEERVKVEGKRITLLAEACSRYAPKSILCVCVAPVSITLPLVAAIFRRTHWYHPGRIIGSVALAQICANSLAAEYQNLDPTSVHVPLLGGPDVDCLVPLFSRTLPLGVSIEESKMLTQIYRGLKPDDSPITTAAPYKAPDAPLSQSFALNRMVTTIALGLCGDSTALCSSFVRTNIFNTCSHLVCTVRFAPGGVVHNYGVPKLSRFELKLLERSTMLLKKRERMAMDFLCCADDQSQQPLHGRSCRAACEEMAV